VSQSRDAGSGALGESSQPGRPSDVVDSSVIVGERIRRAGGYRVDGPEGRIGTFRALVPGDLATGPDRIRVDVGLFARSSVCIPLSDVTHVDPGRRRVLVRSIPIRPSSAAPERRASIEH